MEQGGEHLKVRRYLIYVTASLGILMYSIDSTVVAVAFPLFMRDLGTDVIWAAWTISIFFIGVTMAMPLSGSLSDSLGRRKLFLFSLILFTVSSLACGLAPNISILIAFRLLQGIGGASLLPTASGIVSDHFPENRERAIGLLSSIWPVGGIIGPNLGGWIVSRYSWRYIFYINLPIGALLIGLTMMLIEPSRAPSRPHLDFGGISSMCGSVLLFMLGLDFLGTRFAAPSLLFLALSLVLAFFFLRHEQHEANPIVDTMMLKSRPFLAANLVNLILGGVGFGLFSFVPLYATSVHRLSPLMSGMILTPRSVGSVVAAAVTSFMLKQWRYRWPMVVGFVILTLGVFLLSEGPWIRAITGLNPGSVETLCLLMLVCGIGAGILFPPTNNACIELLPHKVATIVGLRNMFRTVGGALAVSLITLMLHLSPDPGSGFRRVFIAFGTVLLCTIPLVFLIPDRSQR